MSRELYVDTLRDLLSGNPQRIMQANRRLYKACVDSPNDEPTTTEADLALAEVGAS